MCWSKCWVLLSVLVTATVSFCSGRGGGAHAVMMAFVIRKNSHVDYDSHTSYTCLHLFLFGVAAVCSPLLSIRYQQEHCAVFSCAKDPSVGKQYMAESLQDMWLFFFWTLFCFWDYRSCYRVWCSVVGAPVASSVHTDAVFSCSHGENTGHVCSWHRAVVVVDDGTPVHACFAER